jgi:hypothetical protein
MKNENIFERGGGEVAFFMQSRMLLPNTILKLIFICQYVSNMQFDSNCIINQQITNMFV